MRMCEHHWDLLKEGVKNRRMWHFVPTSGEEATERMKAELEQTVKDPEKHFDPLTGSMFNIATSVGKNIERSEDPLAALQAVGDPNWCPLCTVQQSYDRLHSDPAGLEEFKRTAPPGAIPLDAQGWIDRTLDGALEYVKDQGWELDVLQ